MPRVTDIFRHPLKSHGREGLQAVTLTAGQTMPWDRRWAAAHEAAKTDGTAWAPCANFSRGSKAPALMAINAQLDEQTGLLSLTHPDQPSITFDPDGDIDAFLNWVRPLMPADRAQTSRIIRVAGRGMTDTDYPSISINSHASLRALSDHMNTPLSPLRWRGNIWLDDLEPWAEHDWIGRRFTIGEVEFEGVEPIIRCLATTANPETGQRDADTLGALKAGWGHQNFGLYARVIQGGDLRVGDAALAPS